jgi:hypothetical protein
MWFIATIWLNLPKDDGPLKFNKFFLKTHLLPMDVMIAI